MRACYLDERVEVGVDLVEAVEYLAHGGESGRYLVKTVVNRGESYQHVAIITGRRLANGIRTHSVVIWCAVRVGLAWMAVVWWIGSANSGRLELGWCIRRAETLLSSRADHAGKATAVQTVAVGKVQ